VDVDVIEELNAHGPYDHGLWSEVTSEFATNNLTPAGGGASSMSAPDIW